MQLINNRYTEDKVTRRHDNTYNIVKYKYNH